MADLPTIVDSCNIIPTTFNYKAACCYRAVVNAISSDHSTATVEWLESVPSAMTTETEGVPIDTHCMNCLLPTGVAPSLMWLCVGDSVMVLDSMALETDDIPTPVADRFLILGLNAKVHYEALPACFLNAAGFSFDDAKYGEPFFTETDVLDENNDPTGYTQCLPVNPDPLNSKIPLGTVTDSGKILTAISSVTVNEVTTESVVPVKEFMHPNFTAMRTYCKGPYRPRMVNGYIYSIEPTSPVTVEKTESGPPDFINTYDVTVNHKLYLICPRTGYSVDVFGGAANYAQDVDIDYSGFFTPPDSRIWMSYAGAGFQEDGFGDSVRPYVGTDLTYYAQSHYIRIALTPSIQADGSVTYSSVAAPVNNPTVATSAVDFDYNFTETLDPPEDPPVYYYDGRKEYDVTQIRTNSCSGTQVLRSYPEFETSIIHSISHTENYSEYVNKKWEADSSYSVLVEELVDINWTSVGSAVAEFYFGNKRVGETSAAINFSCTRYKPATDTYSYNTQFSVDQKMCIVMGSCGDSKAIIVLTIETSAARNDTNDWNAVNSQYLTVYFVLKLVPLYGVDIVLEQWSYSPPTAATLFRPFFTNYGDLPEYGKSSSWSLLYYNLIGFSIYVPDSDVEEDDSYSYSSSFTYKGFGGVTMPPISWTLLYLAQYDAGDTSVSKDVMDHLAAKFGVSENFFDISYAGNCDAMTGIPCNFRYDHGDNKWYLPLTITTAKDMRQMRVDYSFDGVGKKRYFLDCVEFDMDAVKQM